MSGAGSLDARVTIEQPVEVRDTFGGSTTEWQPVASFWAAVEPLQGREFLEARQHHAEVTHRVRLRYTERVNRTMRVIHRGAVLAIEVVLTIGRREWTHLLTRELVAP